MKTLEEIKEINDLLLKEYLEWIEKENIICPSPPLWGEIFAAIEYGTKSSYNEIVELIGRPLILNAWISSNESKKQRFIEHLKFAHRKFLMHYINFRIDMYQSAKENKDVKFGGNFLQISKIDKREKYISKQIDNYYGIPLPSDDYFKEILSSFNIK